MEELEDELQIASDAKLRLEVYPMLFHYEMAYYKYCRLTFKLPRPTMRENCRLKKIRLKKEDGLCLSRWVY